MRKCGIIPVGLVGDGWGNTKDRFQDLSFCPDSDTSDTSIGACPRTSVRTTDAGGAVYDSCFKHWKSNAIID